MADMAIEQRTLSASGVRLHAVEAGPRDGSVIVLMAGWPQTIHAWRQVIPELAGAGYRVIAIDPPGIGESGMLPSDMTADCGAMADLLDTALRAADINEFALVGHDVGAWLSYSWAVRHPESIGRLVLAEAAIPGLAPAAAFGIQNAAKVFQFYFCATPVLPELLTEGREEIFLRYLFDSKMMVRSGIGEADLQAYASSYSRSGRMTAGFAYYRSVPTSARQNVNAPPPMMPVLAIGGEGSIGDSLHRALVAKGVREVQGPVIPAVGHYIPEEAPVAFARKVLDFLAL